MADRIFAGIILLVAIAYSIIAFWVIKAPFQYDPLGPESWPKILGFVTIPCCLYVLARPDVRDLGSNGRTLLRIAVLIGLLFAYAWLFQRLGFILSTFLFCTALSMMLGARLLAALIFGAATGIGGYFVCTGLLALNLPAGVLAPIL
jgi:putative tricarboxylic transport membrane protein